MDLLKGTCPKCGEVLEIPAHLKQFSCLYCGARLSPADLKQEMAPTEANVDGAAAYQYYVDHVVNAVTGHRVSRKSSTSPTLTPPSSATAP